jgi:carbon monoxide dehydrogenase subunit G
MAHELRQEDLGFLDRAAVRQSRTAVVDMPPDRVFEELAEHPERWPQWLTVARDCHYNGEAPYGVGTKRRLSLRGGIVAVETVLAWDQDKRFAYRVDELNAPGVQAFMEEWTLEPTDEAKTRLQWVIAGDSDKVVQVLFASGRPALDRIFNQAARRMSTI